MAGKLSYRDISHPSLQDTIRGYNYDTLHLVKMVAEFAQKVSAAHEEFASQIHNVVETYQKKNQELRQERPVECPSTLNTVWENLLQETQYDAQAHADTASLLIKNVYNPLLEIASYKRSQSKKLYLFREKCENLLLMAKDHTKQCHKAYLDAFHLYKSNCTTRDAIRYCSEYHNAHNEYVLSIRASNHQQEEYSERVLPYILEELEEIHIDLANTLNGAIESHALLLLTKANEQSRRFENILKCCKQVNPKIDVHNFLMTITQEPMLFEPEHVLFSPPADPTIPGAELLTLKNIVIFDRHTDITVTNKRTSLQKEAAELTTYLKQNQDVTYTLMNVCQRNLANHLYAKVYETQEDLCRKRNEIRLAHLQLAAIRAQIELLSPKQNGNGIESDRESTTSKNKQSIKGMWKKAFKSLKTRDKHPSDRDKDRDEKSSRQSSFKKSLLKRKDSKKKKVPTATLR